MERPRPTVVAGYQGEWYSRVEYERLEAEVERLREALADIHDMCARRLDEKRPRFSPLFAVAIGEKAAEALNGKESP